MAKTVEEKAAEAEAKRIADEKETAELEAKSKEVQAELERKAAEKKAPQADSQGERMFTEAQVKAMIKQVVAELKEKGDEADLDDEDAYAQKKIRIPRFKGKFIYAFKNMNTDEFFPDVKIFAFDVWNSEQKRNEAYATAVFDDGTELSAPLYTLITKSSKVVVDLVETVSEDESYSDGNVELVDVDGYTSKATGVFKKLKVTKTADSYKVKLPNGQIVEVAKEVVNW